MWGQRKPSRSRRVEPPPVDVARECELFLRGLYVAHVREAEKPVPAWVRLNPLAHGTVGELSALVARGPERGVDAEWSTAAAFLATEILHSVDHDPERLLDLQLMVLIPLELRLATRWQLPMRPPQLVQLVSHELERCR